MILIISIDQDDTTSEVIRWLAKFGTPYYRINEYDLINAIDWNLNTGEITLRHEQRIINIHEITAYWYRKGNFRFQQLIDGASESKLLKATEALIQSETKALSYALHSQLKELKGLSNYNFAKVNKLEVLRLAQSFGLRIPNTKILSEKTKLLEFLHQTNGLITKVMDTPIDYYGDVFWMPNYTEKISDEQLDKIPKQFGASLFQEMVEKKYEIRSVFFRGDFYSMAIFSQLDQQTSVDFRHYNFEKPNRTVPYLLPNAEKEQLSKLMAALNLDFGSIDLIVDKQGNHVFLEINPVGQFGMTSYPCNYYLEKKVAQYLSSN